MFPWDSEYKMLIKTENPSGEYMRRVQLSHCYKHNCVEGKASLLFLTVSEEGLIELHSKYFMVIFKGKCSGGFGNLSWQEKCFLRKCVFK